MAYLSRIQTAKEEAEAEAEEQGREKEGNAGGAYMRAWGPICAFPSASQVDCNPPRGVQYGGDRRECIPAIIPGVERVCGVGR